MYARDFYPFSYDDELDIVYLDGKPTKYDTSSWPLTIAQKIAKDMGFDENAVDDIARVEFFR